MTLGTVFDMLYQSPGKRSEVRKHIRKHFNLRRNTLLQLIIREDDHFGNTVDRLWEFVGLMLVKSSNLAREKRIRVGRQAKGQSP